MESSWGCLSVMLLVAAAAGACRSGPQTEDALSERADRLAHELIIVDTHIDVPYRLSTTPDNVAEATTGGDFDYPRARRGGLDVPFFSIYVPASYQETGGAKQLADELIDRVEEIVRENPQKFALGPSVAEVRRQVGQGKIVLAMGMENGAPIERDLANVAYFHRRGIRYITLAHSKANQLSDSSYDEERRWNGLSPLGTQVVAEMNRVGMLVDISHLSDDAARQAIELSVAPVIASHSSCRHFTPDWERNISDELIRRLAERGGVVQINFGSSFLDDAYRREREAQSKELERYFEEHELAADSEEATSYRERYRSAHPIARPDVSRVADHIDHVVRLVGIDHVGLGSDFDGVGDSLPAGLADVAGYPNLIRELIARGYSDDDVRKICGENTLNLWSEVERVAERLASD